MTRQQSIRQRSTRREAPARQGRVRPPGWARALLLAAGLSVTWLAAGAANEVVSLRQSALGRTLVMPSPVAGDAFTLGDRVKITVYENLAGAGDGSEPQALSALIERSEITGTYIVQEDGFIFLPLVGGIEAMGVTGGGLQQGIAERFQRELGAHVTVAIQLVEREPVYVTGDLPQPGTFRYSPGMTVLHALALSGGGTGIAGADRWRQLDLAREQERSSQSRNRLVRLLARLSVLQQEEPAGRDNALRQLSRMTGRGTAEALVSEARAIRAMEREKLDMQTRSGAAVVAALENEAAVLRESLAGAEAVIKDKSERMEFMRQLRERGTTTDQNVHVVRDEYARSQTAWHELRASMARVERNIAEARHQHSLALAEAELAIQREKLAVRQAIVEEETTQAAMARLLLGTDYHTLVAVGGLKERVGLEIIRRTPGGATRMTGDLLSPLRPGDIVNVVRAESSENATAVLAQ